MRRILFTETNLNELPAPPAGYRYIGFDGATFSIQSESGIQPVESGGGGSSEVISVTYQELNSLLESSSLTPCSYYIITDFRTCYDQPDFDYYGNSLTASCYRDSDVHPIIVFSLSDSEISQDAYQPDYPKDKIKYDISREIEK